MTTVGTASPSQATYHFRPMTARDLAMVRAWQSAPHVRDWWDGDPLTLASEDEPAIEQYIIAIDGRPFAYLQCYLQSAYPQNGLGAHPAGTRGIDQLIGAPDMVGRGHGSAFVRAFADGLLRSGAPRVIADPDPRNARAIRAYAKAGFHPEREVVTPDGRALLMVRGNPETERRQ
jgi:aminoglycoside 6'-N-acetyltransferase